jgi:hypothetical protein
MDEDLRRTIAAIGVCNDLHIDHAERPFEWDFQVDYEDDEVLQVLADLADFVPEPIYAARAAN